MCAARTAQRRQSAAAYDEVLAEVAARVSAAGSIGKSDIGALLLWKRLRADTPWARQLMNMPELEVRTLTAPAVDAVRDKNVAVPMAARLGRRLLSPIPGFTTGDALASALLVAAAPDRMAIYDRRAQRGLELLGETQSAAPDRYGRYMHLIEELRELARQHDQPWLARDVDQLGPRRGHHDPDHAVVERAHSTRVLGIRPRHLCLSGLPGESKVRTPEI